MQELSLIEVQLYKLLTAFFGRENVVPNMRVIAICGGQLPTEIRDSISVNGVKMNDWACANRGLFTIVDGQDLPRMVVEFFSSTDQTLDVRELEHKQYLQPILAAAGVRYVTISEGELAEMLDPRGNLDLCSFLEAQVDCLS